LHLFSAAPDLLAFGRSAYRRRSEETSLLLGQLFEKFQGEGLAMPYTMEDFKRDYIKEHFRQLTPKEREEVLRSLPPEERLAGLSAEEMEREVLERLSPERRREILESLPLEERLAGLSPEQIRQYLDRLSAKRPNAPRKPRRKK
jgi:Mg/Co/Ni transporter MgtE